jgi:N-glycosylase/DNA lyase
MHVDEHNRTLTVTLKLRSSKPRTVTIGEAEGHGVIEIAGRAPGRAAKEEIIATVRQILRLDVDLSAFYEAARNDEDLAWVAAEGAGRMVRSQSVFEDVIKTVCTTNCSWALTTKMVAALVSELGEAASTAPAEGPWGRTFPTPEVMASRDEKFYREIVRSGYRAPYLMTLARLVADGDVDLESLGEAPPTELSDEDLAARLVALPGLGPYAVAHVMMILGRSKHLILDSWTRPTYARLMAKKKVADSTINRRFATYGDQAGLAFWLFLTRDWVDQEA